MLKVHVKCAISNKFLLIAKKRIRMKKNKKKTMHNKIIEYKNKIYRIYALISPWYWYSNKVFFS